MSRDLRDTHYIIKLIQYILGPKSPETARLYDVTDKKIVLFTSDSTEENFWELLKNIVKYDLK